MNFDKVHADLFMIDAGYVTLDLGLFYGPCPSCYGAGTTITHTVVIRISNMTSDLFRCQCDDCNKVWFVRVLEGGSGRVRLYWPQWGSDEIHYTRRGLHEIR